MKAFHQIPLVLAAILAFTAVPCFSAQVAILKNGFSINHERREVVGDVTRLYLTADGASFVDIPTSDIEHYEAAPDPPVAAPRTRAESALRYAGQNTTSPVDLNEVINQASGRYRLDPDLVNSVIKAESGFNVRAVSRKGAQGLMQLMPGTASQLGVPNAFDPQANVEGGTKYLRELLERYNFDMVKALAAYNAGPRRVEQFGGVPPYYETRAYVSRIVRDFNKKKLAQQKAAAQTSVAVKKPAPAPRPKARPASAVTETKVAAKRSGE